MSNQVDHHIEEVSAGGGGNASERAPAATNGLGTQLPEGQTGNTNNSKAASSSRTTMMLVLGAVVVGVVLLIGVLGFVFLPKLGGSSSSSSSSGAGGPVPMHPPLTDPPAGGNDENGEGGQKSARIPSTNGLSSAALRASGDAFFRTGWADSDACDLLDANATSSASGAPLALSRGRSAEVADWIEAATKLLIGFGTRVAGSNSNGNLNAHHMLTRMSSCLAGSKPSTLNGIKRAKRQWWHMRHDNFSEGTPLGRRSFSNVVAEFNFPPSGRKPNPKGHLMLTAHWDSKYFTNIEFLGACDSAVPCVMILRMMRELSSIAEAATSASDNFAYTESLPSVTVIFFDGEEAFHNWQGNDNTYGSRHIATQYERENRISNISLFVLLDLMGPARPTFWNYFASQSDAAFKRVFAIEREQKGANQRLSPWAQKRQGNVMFFKEESPYTTTIDDDHKHWLNRGVPILHLIPVPFPSSWHNDRDNGQEIDYQETTVDLYNIVAQFVREFDERKIPTVKKGIAAAGSRR